MHDTPATASGEVQQQQQHFATVPVVLKSCKAVSMQGILEEAYKCVNSDDLMGFDL
jgi:hypothetical protein